MQVTTTQFGLQFQDAELLAFLETVNYLVYARKFDSIKVQIKNTLFVKTGSSDAMPGLVRELHQQYKRQHPRAQKINLQFTWIAPGLQQELAAVGDLMQF